MDTKANLTEEINSLVEKTSNEKDFASSDSERLSANDNTRGQCYSEMDNKINIKQEVDISYRGLSSCSLSPERNDRRRHDFEINKINFKEEVDISYNDISSERESGLMDRDMNYENDIKNFEMDDKINIKDVDILDTDILNESVCFSTNIGSRPKNNAVTCGSDLELDNITESKGWDFVPSISFQNEEKCFTSDHLRKKELSMHNENGEVSFETSTKTENKLEAFVSNFCQQSENRDRKTEVLESAEISRLSEDGISPVAHGEEIMESPWVGKNVYSHRTQKCDSKERCLTTLHSENQVLNNDTGLQHETFGKVLKLNNCIIHGHKKVHKCDAGQNSISLSNLKGHNLIHEGKNPYECNVCNTSLTCLSELKTHKLIHEDKKPHECNICKKSFTHLSHLKRHKLIHEDKKPHECNICKKSFIHLSHLKTHKMIHEGKKPHECNICNKRFTKLSNLKEHKLIHEDKKPRECNICNKSFTHLSTLKTHMLIHEGRKPHKCNICNKSFTQTSTLKIHKLIHEGKKPHECNICNKSFTQISNLKRHSLIHEGKKPHECNICNKSFTQLSDLKTHKLIHEGKKAHECNICNKRFIQLSNLKTHKLIHEGKKPKM